MASGSRAPLALEPRVARPASGLLWWGAAAWLAGVWGWPGAACAVDDRAPCGRAVGAAQGPECPLTGRQRPASWSSSTCPHGPRRGTAWLPRSSLHEDEERGEALPGPSVPAPARAEAWRGPWSEASRGPAGRAGRGSPRGHQPELPCDGRGAVSPAPHPPVWRLPPLPARGWGCRGRVTALAAVLGPASRMVNWS